MNRLQAVKRDGQSLWLDFIERKLMSSGQLARMVAEDGICGLTSNPAIFQKAIGSTNQYDADIAAILNRGDTEPSVLFEALAIEDIRGAADVMRSVYAATKAADGYISLEVSPHLAADTAGTIASARRLWKAVDRPNLMIKVPGTAAGIVAIRQLISEGINVNVTLLFDRAAYRVVANAYIDGIAALAKSGGDASRVARVASVASFFVSRIDVAADALLDAKIAEAKSKKQRDALQGLLGKVAIANAKLAYQDYLETFNQSPRWQALAKQGAQAQRLLWASTGTKNPNYRDVIYMEELIGANTVNTVPPATLDAFRDHGESRSVLLTDIDAARGVISALDKTAISLKKVTDKLLVDGLVLFADADDQLMAAIADKRKTLLQGKMAREQYALPERLQRNVDKTLDNWRVNGNVRRLWARDADMWSGGDEARWLDWLDEIDKIGPDAKALNQFSLDVVKQGYSTALLIGMGGSSLGPEVLSLVYGPKAKQGVKLLVLDSVDPAQIAALEAELDFAKTLFVVASKSGSTLEPDILCRYFYAQAKAKLGKDTGAHFVAITDPGSKLREYAKKNGFARIFDGEPGIGGRYSIYSNFGMVPAALIGIDIKKLVGQAQLMVNSCRPSNTPRQNPGVILGVMLGAAAKAGRDKLTLIASPALAPFGAWVEQLIAESTGKQGHGIVPVDAEPLGSVGDYSKDRIFVYLRMEDAPDPAQEALSAALINAGQPVLTFTLSRSAQLLQEFFRWEMATAVAGAVLGIHPFDQPDVEAAKIQARALLDRFERDKKLPQPKPLLKSGALSFYGAAPVKAAKAKKAAKTTKIAKAAKTRKDKTDVDIVGEFLATLGKGDYFAVLAYLPMLEPHKVVLQEIRKKIRNQKKVATCLGFGPRFLHSTGQLYKGGPNSGVFLVLTCDEAKDVAVPDSAASFGVVKSAQASGDTAVLLKRGRRVLRVNIGSDVGAGLARLSRIVDEALK